MVLCRCGDSPQQKMRSTHDLQLQLMLMLLTMILLKFSAAAATSRHNSDSDLVHVGQGRPECVDCRSSDSGHALDRLRITAGNSVRVYGNNDDFQQNSDADEPTHLRGSVHLNTKKTVDERRPEAPGRRRRSLRPTKTVELAETSRGQLLTLGTDYAERFAFKDPAPHSLDISAVMGNVLLREGHRLDYETEPKIEFVVVVTRVDDVACES